MAFEFTETVTIELPDVESQLSAFAENDYNLTHGLIVEVAAIHEGLTSNYNMYTAEALEASLASWVTPYPKPIILNHDLTSEPIGRVMAAKMEQEADGTPYVLLQIAVTDPEAVSKVADQRYLTGSVGGKAESATCSICGADWTEASITNIPCRHSRGKTYKGKLAYIEVGGISFREYSFVNVPADKNSSVRKITRKTNDPITTGEQEDDGWVRSARLFSINMDEQEILEFSESEGQDVLDNLTEREASPVYMQIKGAFLSALATASFSEAEDDKNNPIEEQDVTTENMEDEDILAVAEELSSDLEDSVEETEEEVAEEEQESPSDVDAEEGAGEEEDAADAEETEEAEEAEEVEGQEKPSGDVDSENSDGAPVSREADEEDDSEEEAPADEEEADDEESDEEAEEEEVPAAEESDTETDLNEEQTLESRVEELEAENGALRDENGKLRKLLKRNLAERVVDMKVAVGLVNEEDRKTALEEHVERSASSLADSIRDLATMPRPQVNSTDMPKVTEKTSVTDEGEKVVSESDDDTPQVTPEERFEDVMVERLLGKRSF